MRGVGPKTIAALKNARFRIEARKHGDADAPDDIEGVRLNVSGMGEQVWRHRSNIDLYPVGPGPRCEVSSARARAPRGPRAPRAGRARPRRAGHSQSTTERAVDLPYR